MEHRELCRRMLCQQYPKSSVYIRRSNICYGDEGVHSAIPAFSRTTTWKLSRCSEYTYVYSYKYIFRLRITYSSLYIHVIDSLNAKVFTFNHEVFKLFHFKFHFKKALKLNCKEIIIAL